MKTENLIEIYQAGDGSTQINVQFEEDMVWLTQVQMMELFGKARTTITECILNVFSENELVQEATCRKFRQVRTEGKRTIESEIEHYN
ncbi:hypothetical protein [Kaistella yonginensis]|uniref:hypothetical protein n=1 Tax=Kaistella yonginensis TaxID=658267 RepID=UPI0025B32B01|nr:hypothetical protein [Kaistella yonginensis]MDN3606792.1 hypothetical protein [Kaistella yonginensis]